MSICVEKNSYGNFIICEIKLILIRADGTEIYFLGNTSEIIYNTHLGVYEKAVYRNCESRSQWLAIFPHSTLLSTDPIPLCSIKCTPVYLMKYAPFDPDM